MFTLSQCCKLPLSPCSVYNILCSHLTWAYCLELLEQHLEPGQASLQFKVNVCKYWRMSMDKWSCFKIVLSSLSHIQNYSIKYHKENLTKKLNATCNTCNTTSFKRSFKKYDLNLSLITDFKYHQKKRRKNKFVICTHHTPDLASMSDRHFSVWSMSDTLLFS